MTAPADIAALDAEITALKSKPHHLETIVEEKDKEAQAADGANDIVENAEFIPLDKPGTTVKVKSWPEDNYEDFTTKCAALSASLAISTKLPYPPSSSSRNYLPAARPSCPAHWSFSLLQRLTPLA